MTADRIVADLLLEERPVAMIDRAEQAGPAGK
jgi:hypothetical protein